MMTRDMRSILDLLNEGKTPAPNKERGARPLAEKRGSGHFRQYLAVLTETMSRREALAVFQAAGVNVEGMTPKKLLSTRNMLAKKAHPDMGGSLERMKDLNAAYDALKDGEGETGARSPRKSKSPREKEFTMSSMLDDDPPNPLESIHTNIFPVDNPTICARWYSWSRSIGKTEAEQLLGLKDGHTIEEEDKDRAQSTPTHRYMVTRKLDNLVFKFTHHSYTGRGADEQVAAEFGAIEYALPIADLSREYEVLLRAPEKARKVYAWNRANRDNPWLTGDHPPSPHAALD